MELQLKTQQIEKAERQNTDLQTQLIEQQKLHLSTGDNDMRKLQEEITKLRSLNKNRDQILQEMDQKNQSLRHAETSLKLVQNDLELMQSQNYNLE